MPKLTLPEKYICTSVQGYQRAHTIVKWLASAPINLNETLGAIWAGLWTEVDEALEGVDYSDLYDHVLDQDPELIAMGTNLYVRVTTYGVTTDIPIVVEIAPA